ncbi:MAG: ABC transporter ATP-binding protein [Planctomycetes bacterium]|nr:ABC transporter ATP-binding protein [Planctomycetota bacterium]
MDDRIVRAHQLSKWYGPFQALRDVSFELAPREIVGFLGPNGAGKSTTMKILTGFVAPTSGTAAIAGHDLIGDPLACRRAIGYLPEELPLYLDMTVSGYLDHVARLKGIARAERRREVVEAIDAAWLGENSERHLRKLSKGNRQRVGVAQALLGKPPLLILDEPTSGLDPSQVANFRELVRRLADKHTILLSTHILAEVEAVCSRVVVVHRGATIADESIDDLKRRAARATRLRVRVRGDDASALADALAGESWATILTREGDALTIEAPADRRGDIVAAAERHGGLRELREERLSLEEVFRDLTMEKTVTG